MYTNKDKDSNIVFAGTKRLRRRSAPILEYTFFSMILICSLKDNLLSNFTCIQYKIDFLKSKLKTSRKKTDR